MRAGREGKGGTGAHDSLAGAEAGVSADCGQDTGASSAPASREAALELRRQYRAMRRQRLRILLNGEGGVPEGGGGVEGEDHPDPELVPSPNELMWVSTRKSVELQSELKFRGPQGPCAGAPGDPLGASRDEECRRKLVSWNSLSPRDAAMHRRQLSVPSREQQKSGKVSAQQPQEQYCSEAENQGVAQWDGGTSAETRVLSHTRSFSQSWGPWFPPIPEDESPLPKSSSSTALTGTPPQHPGEPPKHSGAPPEHPRTQREHPGTRSQVHNLSASMSEHSRKGAFPRDLSVHVPPVITEDDTPLGSPLMPSCTASPRPPSVPASPKGPLGPRHGKHLKGQLISPIAPFGFPLSPSDPPPPPLASSSSSSPNPGATSAPHPSQQRSFSVPSERGRCSQGKVSPWPEAPAGMNVDVGDFQKAASVLGETYDSVPAGMWQEWSLSTVRQKHRTTVPGPGASPSPCPEDTAVGTNGVKGQSLSAQGPLLAGHETIHSLSTPLWPAQTPQLQHPRTEATPGSVSPDATSIIGAVGPGEADLAQSNNRDVAVLAGGFPRKAEGTRPRQADAAQRGAPLLKGGNPCTEQGTSAGSVFFRTLHFWRMVAEPLQHSLKAPFTLQVDRRPAQALPFLSPVFSSASQLDGAWDLETRKHWAMK